MRKKIFKVKNIKNKIGYLPPEYWFEIFYARLIKNKKYILLVAKIYGFERNDLS